jgi:iron complex outermembrane receptor protein
MQWRLVVVVKRQPFDSQGQPMAFGCKARATAGAATDVTGGVRCGGLNNAGRVLGTGTQYHTVQDHGKLKLAMT